MLFPSWQAFIVSLFFVPRLLLVTIQGVTELCECFFLDSGNIAARYIQHFCDFPLCGLFTRAQAVTQLHNQTLPPAEHACDRRTQYVRFQPQRDLFVNTVAFIRQFILNRDAVTVFVHADGVLEVYIRIVFA